METRDLATIDQATGEMLPAVPDTFSMTRAPAETLAQAQQAAKLLMGVIRQKPKPVRFNGETYLEFEDWQTVAAFFGVTVGCEKVEPIELGGVTGFVAYAVARRSDGQVVSSADAVCMKDEPNWRTRPLYAVRSMAQTRACAKALRNVFAWVAVMAGYKPTPAEEMPIAVIEARAAPHVQEPEGDTITITGKVAHFAALDKKRDGSPMRSVRYVWGMASGEKFSTFDAELGERVQDAHTADESILVRGSAEIRFGAHEATHVEVAE